MTSWQKDFSREKLSEITGANVTLIDEWLNGTKEPDKRQI